MRLAIGLTALALLAASVAQGQRLEPSRFSDRKDATRLITPIAFISQDTTRCDHSVPRFLGQFLAGTLGGAASAVLFLGISSFGDDEPYGDSFSSVTFLRQQFAAQAVGAAVGAWTAAPRKCRAFVPALVGSVVSGIAFLPVSEQSAPAIIGAFIFGIPIQAMGATVAQTLARLPLRLKRRILVSFTLTCEVRQTRPSSRSSWSCSDSVFAARGRFS